MREVYINRYGECTNVFMYECVHVSVYVSVHTSDVYVYGRGCVSVYVSVHASDVYVYGCGCVSSNVCCLFECCNCSALINFNCIIVKINPRVVLLYYLHFSNPQHY